MTASQLPLPQLLRELGLVGWSLVAVVGIAALVVCWFFYFALISEDSPLQVAAGLLRGILRALERELREPMKDPALRIEKFMILVIVLAFFGTLLFWMIAEIARLPHGVISLIFAFCLLLAFLLTGILSGSFAKHYFGINVG